MTLTDEEARSTSKMLQGYFRNRRLPPDSVDDAVQDVLAAILMQPEGMIRCLSAYAVGAAKNQRSEVIRHLIRHNERYCDLGVRAFQVASGDNPLRDAATAERKRVMASLIAALPQLQRELLVRFYVAGQSAGDICGELGISPGRFRVEKSRAKARLTARMGAMR